jgi:peptide methionine sulfoxide reductase msrA/msrB
MEFLGGIFIAIGGWFGFGATPVAEVPTEPVAVVEEAAETQVGSQTESVKSMIGSGEPAAVAVDIQTAMVAGGCFWCVEADLEKTPGVISVVSGYAGGSTDNPAYQNYGSGGHREVVEVTYDANQVSYEDLLIVTLKTTDPTDDDGTFGDRGNKYSAAFYFETPEQKQIIENLIVEVNENGPYTTPLAIDIESRPAFWVAEDNHQDYYKGLLTKVKYKYYRDGSGRTAFIKKHWGDDISPNLPWRNESAANNTTMNDTTYSWSSYIKPDKETLQATMDAVAFRVTQEDGTERAGTSPLDKVNDRGIFVDVLSGEPLFSSRDKFDSGTGWPSFVAPISADAVTAHEDRKLFSVRTETRSAIADNHIGHVFNDGPADRGGLRYCMNGAALRFVPEASMASEGYSDFLAAL